MQIASKPPADPTPSRQLGRSTQVDKSQGSQSSLVRVEVTVLRAHNVPHIKTVFGGKREYFVTIVYQATTKKAKKTKKTKSVQIEGQTAVWNQTLDAFFVQPSSHLVLCLYAKRLTQRDLLIGTHEITIPAESEIDISFVLSHGNGQAGQSTQAVTLNLTISVSANRTSLSAHLNILNEGDDSPAEEAPTPAVAPDSMGPDQSVEPEHPLPEPDFLPVQSRTPVSQGQGDIEKARTGLDRADEAKKLIDLSNTWEGVVGRIKWLMDTLSPVAELHPIAKMAYNVLSIIPQELSNQYQRDDKVRSLIKSMHNAFDFTRHEDTLKSIKPNSKQAEILTLMLRDVCGCSDFIQSYTKDSRFLMRMLKNTGSGVEEKIQELSATLNEHRRAFLDHALITTEITAFQILNDVGNISAKVEGISTRLEWVSCQVLDATLDAKIGDIAYREGSRFTQTRAVFREHRVLVLLGLAGTGKSSIAHEIAHRFAEMDRLTSSFFFVRKEHSKSEAYHLFTNLARDLADRYPLFKAALGKVVRTTLRFDAAHDLHIVGPIIVVIDALDESGDATGESGLHRFLANNLSSLPSNFRVLITSRPEDGIESAFLAAESVAIKYMKDHQLAATTHGDILAFLRERLPPHNFKQYGEALARKAEGLFQWVAVACGYILEPKPVRSRKGRIELLLRSNADHHGQDLLTELYKGVLEEYFSDEEAQGLFRSVIGQLLAAFEPLSIHSLTILRRHSSSDGDEDSDSVVETLRYLGSLLSNVTSSDHTLPVVPLHTSFRDFATSEEKSNDFYVDLRVAHHQLAHSCLSLMLDDLKFNICNLETSYLANKDVKDLDVRIAKHLPPVLSYACRLWDYHLKHLDFDTDLVGKLETFFKEKFLFWLEALSLMDNVSLATPALSSLSIWLHLVKT
ncbi:hypothetical protein EI94DRAFT_1831160 [Lactarius quietus]|nr:hypothetical protein EI94DRAFT_1831160 [Lactarius quietus]